MQVIDNAPRNAKAGAGRKARSRDAERMAYEQASNARFEKLDATTAVAHNMCYHVRGVLRYAVPFHACFYTTTLDSAHGSNLPTHALE